MPMKADFWKAIKVCLSSDNLQMDAIANVTPETSKNKIKTKEIIASTAVCIGSCLMVSVLRTKSGSWNFGKSTICVGHCSEILKYKSEVIMIQIKSEPLILKYFSVAIMRQFNSDSHMIQLLISPRDRIAPPSPLEATTSPTSTIPTNARNNPIPTMVATFIKCGSALTIHVTMPGMVRTNTIAPLRKAMNNPLRYGELMADADSDIICGIIP